LPNGDELQAFIDNTLAKKVQQSSKVRADLVLNSLEKVSEHVIPVKMKSLPEANREAAIVNNLSKSELSERKRMKLALDAMPSMNGSPVGSEESCAAA